MHSSHDNISPKIENMSNCDSPNEPIYSVTDALTHLKENNTEEMQNSILTSKVSEVSVPPLLEIKYDNQESQIRLAHRRVHLVPVTQKQIECLDTAPIFAVRHQVSERQQQDMFVSNMTEGIESCDTLQLSAITSPLAQQVQSDRSQGIVNAAGGAAIAGAGDLISAILRYATNVLMTNIVSQSIYGTYVAVYTAAILIGYIAPLGMDSAISRFLPTHLVKGEHDLATGVLRFMVWMTLILGLFCGFWFYLAAPILAYLVYHQGSYVTPLREISLLVPLMALQTVLVCGLQALKAVKWKVYIDRLIQPGLTLILIGVFYLLGLRLEALIFATICGFLVSVVMGQVLLHKAANKLIRNVVPRFEVKAWLRFAIPMSFNSMILNILSSTDVLFLTAFATATQVGLYAAPDRASLLVTMPLLALNIIFSPLIAEHYALGQHEQLRSMAKVITKWSFTLSLPVFLCFCVFHEAILSIFSREYTAAGIVLVILSFGNLVDAGVGSVWNILAMTGHARVILANTLLTIVFNIGLAFLLVPRYNIIGAAISASLAVILINIAGFIEVFCILKIFTLRWDMLKPMLAGGVASGLGMLLIHIVPVGYGYQAIFGILCLVIPFMLIYIAVLALLRFSNDDRIVFDAIYAKFGKRNAA